MENALYSIQKTRVQILQGRELHAPMLKFRGTRQYSGRGLLKKYTAKLIHNINQLSPFIANQN